MDIAELLAFVVKNKASDLHLSSGLPPMIRVHGDVRRINLPPLDHKDVHAMIYDIMNDGQRKQYEEVLKSQEKTRGDADASLMAPLRQMVKLDLLVTQATKAEHRDRLADDGMELLLLLRPEFLQIGCRADVINGNGLVRRLGLHAGQRRGGVRRDRQGLRLAGQTDRQGCCPPVRVRCPRPLRGAGRDRVHRAQGGREGLHQPAQGAVHDLDAPAGGEPQVRLRAGAHDASGAAPL